MDSKINLLFQSLDIICESRLWKDKKPSEVLRILIYLHNKGWLYTPMVNGKVKMVIGAYRVTDSNDETLAKIPQEEKGKIIYVPFAISLNKEDNIYRVVRETIRKYLEENRDIEEIILEGKDDKLRRYKIGARNGKEQGAELTSATAVYGES